MKNNEKYVTSKDRRQSRANQMNEESDVLEQKIILK
jgi:hypothetical protein